MLLGKDGKPMHVGPPLHFHLYQDEIFHILDGEFLFQVGDETFNLKAGDTLFAPRQVPHAFVNTSDTLGSMVTIFQPSGKMEDFFQKLHIYTAEHHGVPPLQEFSKLLMNTT